jgi:hypothetical protein
MLGPNHDVGHPSTQDVRFMSAHLEYHHDEIFNSDLYPALEGAPWPPNANVITCELRESKVVVGSIIPAVAVMTRAMRGNQQVELEPDVHEECSLEELPRLSDLEEVVRVAGRASNEAKERVEVGPDEKGEFEPFES